MPRSVSRMLSLPVEATFSAAWRISCGRNELAFLDVHDAAGAAGLDQQIGLAAQERRDLQDVDRLGRGFGLRRLVNIGQDRETRASRTILQNPQAFLQPGPAIGRRRCCGWPCRRTL